MAAFSGRIQDSILYEDNHVIAVNKPCGILSQPDGSSAEDLFSLIKNYIRIQYNKPGDAYLGLIHRLDRNVSGITVFAKTSKAAGRLAEAFRKKTVNKTYHAVTECIPSPESGILEDFIQKNEAKRRAEASPYGKQAKLEYSILEKGQSAALIEIRLETGRFHQIRFQLSSRGWPIAGDEKYGGKLRTEDGCIALHACRLEFIHPVKKTEMKIECPDPAEWKKLIS